MNKMKLGDDFAEDGEEVETTEEENKEESEEEEEEEEEEEDSAGTSTGEEENEESEENEEVDDKKARELQGLENAEKELDNDLSDLDENITKARERIVSKRQARRDKRQIIQEVDNKIPEKETDDSLDDIDTDAVATIERVIKAKGYVRQQDVEQKERQTAHKTAQDAFYAKHPEYDVKNDKDDFLYKALCAELADFAAPIDSQKIPVLFEKAHMAVKLAHPEFFKEAKNKKIAEKAQRIKTAGIGGGSSKSGASSEEDSETLSDRKRQILLDGGWSEEDINEL